MPSVPIAAFLTGALLSLLVPVALLIALTAWYWLHSARAPAADDTSSGAIDPAPALPPEPGPPASGA